MGFSHPLSSTPNAPTIRLPRGLRGSDKGAPPLGALIVQLEAGAPFDDDVLALRRSDAPKSQIRHHFGGS